MQIRIGDYVKFLSEKTEGRVTGVVDRDTVVVYCEEYGFDVPAAVSDLVVVVPEGGARPGAVEEALRSGEEERSGAVLLAFVPDKPHTLAEARYELFLVNDTGQTALYSLFFFDGEHFRGIAAGNCNSGAAVSLGLYSLKEIDTTMKAVHVQAVFFTKGNAEVLPAIDAEVRINPVQLCKGSSYKANKWFSTPAYLISLNEESARSTAGGAERPEHNAGAFAATSKMADAQTASYGATGADMPVHEPEERRVGNVVEVDLHIHQLLDSTSGMSNHDMLEYQLNTFRKTMEQYKLRKGQKIVFIHGKGDGVLRQRILWELERGYKKCQHQDASFKQYGFGATMVTIR